MILQAVVSSLVFTQFPQQLQAKKSDANACLTDALLLMSWMQQVHRHHQMLCSKGRGASAWE